MSSSRSRIPRPPARDASGVQYVINEATELNNMLWDADDISTATLIEEGADALEALKGEMMSYGQEMAQGGVGSPLMQLLIVITEMKDRLRAGKRVKREQKDRFNQWVRARQPHGTLRGGLWVMWPSG